MKTLSKEAEDQILDAIQDVCEHVTGGEHPTDAVVKVAGAMDLSPNFVRLVCTGYNTGATTYQREKAANILDKMAEFPLADPDAVLRKLYPTPEAPSILKTSSVVSDEYSRAPRASENSSLTRRFREKVASTKILPGTTDGSGREERQLPARERMKHAYCQALDLKRAMEEKRAQYAKAQDDLLSSLGRLTDAIKQNDRGTAELEGLALDKYGEAGKRLFDYVACKLPHIKRAAQGVKFIMATWTDPVPKLMADCIDKSAAVCAARVAYRELESASQDKIGELLDPFEVARNQTEPAKTSVLSQTDSSSSTSKQAAGMLGWILGSTAAKYLGNQLAAPRDPGAMASGIGNELDDPDHENELRRIQARTMLQDLMQNDEVISGYDPGEVLEAYNEIVGVTPRSSTHAGIMRPMLRKRLTQGAIEPFEAAEMVNIEGNLGKAQQHTIEAPPQSPIAKQGSVNVLQHKILGQ